MRTSRNIAAPDGPVRCDAGCDEVRCGCGSLLARVIGLEVELKCRRCKQVWRLPLEAASPRALRPFAARRPRSACGQG